MFSGIIENTCTIKNIIITDDKCGKILLFYPNNNLSIGDSVAVNGVCLTVASINQSMITFELSSETMEITNISKLTNEDEVNVELPLTLNKYISGHLVSVHFYTTE